MNNQYISGFFDADGSITMSYKSKSNKFRIVRVDFTNIELNILTEMKTYLESLGIKTYLSKKSSKNKSHSTSYTLSTNSSQMSLKLCELLESVHPKKIHRINTVLKYHNLVTNRNGKYTDREKIRKKAYERLFFLR